MVEEAGGRVTDFTGGAVNLDEPRVVVSNGRIHEEMLQVLEETRGR
jgi:fructose-1,6-bisphosphatase/inositol monophosphatase family enzyme